MTKKMKFTMGFNNVATVEVTNRQQSVEYKIISGCADEKEVRSSVGNALRGTYDHYYSGFYSQRKKAVARIESDIEQLESDLETLRFALKVTKKKNWAVVK